MLKLENSVYSKKEIDDLKLTRDRQILKPLLWNRDLEEGTATDKIKNYLSVREIDFTKPVLIFSESQVYKTLSIIGLVKYHNRMTKYTILDLTIFLDIWFSDNSITTKNRLITTDILIIHSRPNLNNTNYKATALIELLDTRKTLGKITWLFIESMNREKFNSLYIGVEEQFSRTFDILF